MEDFNDCAAFQDGATDENGHFSSFNQINFSFFSFVFFLFSGAKQVCKVPLIKRRQHVDRKKELLI